VDLIKPAGRPATAFVNPMERDEAAQTGLAIIVVDPADDLARLRHAGGDTNLARAMRVRDSLLGLNVQGRIAVYGQVDAGRSLAIVRHLETLLPKCSFVSDTRAGGVMLRARMTKDESEIEAIRRVGRATVDVVGAVAELLRESPVQDGMLSAGSAPLTIGQVKAKIHLMLAERGVRSPEGPIFAQGRDGAIGHSTGTDGDPIRLGSPIVFDIYPHGPVGYYYDFTRTWCLDHAEPAVLDLYTDVRTVFEAVFPMLVPGASPMDLQVEVCRRFESLGHPTLLSDANTRSGYFHGLAHGVGLEIHEPPVFRHYMSEDEVALQPGMVITLEPGLYYPAQAMGVRLEDTVLIRADGGPEILVPYPYDLTLPLHDGPAEGH
jgi:Xaa-Pro aminopeptidase